MVLDEVTCGMISLDTRSMYCRAADDESVLRFCIGRTCTRSLVCPVLNRLLRSTARGNESMTGQHCACDTPE